MTTSPFRFGAAFSEKYVIVREQIFHVKIEGLQGMKKSTPNLSLRMALRHYTHDQLREVLEDFRVT